MAALSVTAAAPTPPEVDLDALVETDGRRAVSLGVQAYGAELLSFLAALHGSRDVAAEVFAQTCEDLVRTLPRFRRRCSLRTWMYALARNASRRHAEEGFHRRRADLSVPELEQPVRTATATFLRTGWKDRFRALRDTLSPDDRALLILRVDRGLSWSDIAEVLGEPGGAKAAPALRKRFERIKARLKEGAVAAGWLDRG